MWNMPLKPGRGIVLGVVSAVRMVSLRSVSEISLAIGTRLPWDAV
jgi:hypothetical protein